MSMTEPIMCQDAQAQTRQPGDIQKPNQRTPGVKPCMSVSWAKATQGLCGIDCCLQAYGSVSHTRLTLGQSFKRRAKASFLKHSLLALDRQVRHDRDLFAAILRIFRALAILVLQVGRQGDDVVFSKDRSPTSLWESNSKHSAVVRFSCVSSSIL